MIELRAVVARLPIVRRSFFALSSFCVGIVAYGLLGVPAVSAEIVRVGSPSGRYVDGPKAKTAAPAAKTATPSRTLSAPKPGDVSAEEILIPGELADLKLGSKDAKITIVEYASMTCGHCAQFHENVLPKLKEKYIDTGKVRLIMREFPLDNLAAAASMLARCTGDDKALAFISVLFAKQKDWAAVRGSPIPPLFELAKQVGFTKERFDACLKDQKMLGKILKTRERASTTFGVTSTPTFFINGKKLKGGQEFKKFEEIIDPMLAEG